jgi:hypothetical protein
MNYFLMNDISAPTTAFTGDVTPCFIKGTHDHNANVDSNQ